MSIFRIFHNTKGSFSIILHNRAAISVMLGYGGDADGQQGAVGAHLQHAAGGQIAAAVPDEETASRGPGTPRTDHTARSGDAVIPRGTRGGGHLQASRKA